MPNIGQDMPENVFYALLFILSGRFGGDWVCIRGIPG